MSLWFGISNICGGMWSNGLGQNRENNEEHDEDCVEEGFRLASAKLGRNDKGGRKALVWGIVVSIFEMNQNWS